MLSGEVTITEPFVALVTIVKEVPAAFTLTSSSAFEELESVKLRPIPLSSIVTFWLTVTFCAKTAGARIKNASPVKRKINFFIILFRSYVFL